MKKRYSSVVAAVKLICCMLFFFLPLLWLLLSAAVLYFIVTHSYQDILDWYSQHWPDGYPVSRVSGDSFTLAWYQKIQACWPLIAIGLLLITGSYAWQARRIWSGLALLMRELGRIFRKMRQVYREMTRKYKVVFWGLFGVIAVYRIYFYLAFPLIPDEICSYLFFSRQGWLMTTTNYHHQ